MREIILTTVPHTGTHTMHYLFGELGGIPVWWCHFEKASLNLLNALIRHDEFDWNEFVHVQTFRSDESTRESFERRRAGKKIETDYFDKCNQIRDGLTIKMLKPIVINIEAPIAQKTEEAMKVFKRVGIEPSPEAIEFMKTWPKVNSYEDPFEGGRKDAVQKQLRPRYISELIETLEERKYGT